MWISSSSAACYDDVSWTGRQLLDALRTFGAVLSAMASGADRWVSDGELGLGSCCALWRSEMRVVWDLGIGRVAIRKQCIPVFRC